MINDKLNSLKFSSVAAFQVLSICDFSVSCIYYKFELMIVFILVRDMQFKSVSC